MQLTTKKTQHWADFRESKLGLLFKFSRILMQMLWAPRSFSGRNSSSIFFSSTSISNEVIPNSNRVLKKWRLLNLERWLWSTVLAVKPWGWEFKSKHLRYKQGITSMPITPARRELRQEHCCDLLASRITKKTWVSDLGRDPPQRNKQSKRRVHPVPSSSPCAHTDTHKQRDMHLLLDVHSQNCCLQSSSTKTASPLPLRCT